MTIRFELRTTKKAKGADTVPLHISVSDGREFRQRQVTNIMVSPEHWDAKAGDLKKRVLIKEEVRQKLILYCRWKWERELRLSAAKYVIYFPVFHGGFANL